MYLCAGQYIMYALVNQDVARHIFCRARVYQLRQSIIDLFNANVYSNQYVVLYWFCRWQMGVLMILVLPSVIP